MLCPVTAFLVEKVPGVALVTAAIIKFRILLMYFCQCILCRWALWIIVVILLCVMPIQLAEAGNFLSCGFRHCKFIHTWRCLPGEPPCSSRLGSKHHLFWRRPCDLDFQMGHANATPKSLRRNISHYRSDRWMSSVVLRSRRPSGRPWRYLLLLSRSVAEDEFVKVEPRPAIRNVE